MYYYPYSTQTTCSNVFIAWICSCLRRNTYRLLQKGVITTEVGYKPGQIVSSIFLQIPRRMELYRLILNLKKFNESVTHHLFKTGFFPYIYALQLVTGRALFHGLILQLWKMHTILSPLKLIDRNLVLCFKWDEDLYECHMFTQWLILCTQAVY